MYAISHKKPYVPSVGGIRLLCNVYIGRGQSLFCETSAKVTNWVTDPFRWLCELFLKGLWLEGENFDVSPESKVVTLNSIFHQK